MAKKEEAAHLREEMERRKQVRLEQQMKQEEVARKLQDALQEKQRTAEEMRIMREKRRAEEERERQKAMIEIERKHNADVAAKSVVQEEEKRKKADEIREQKKQRLEVFEHKKKIKKEWRHLQDGMIKNLAEKLRLWKSNGTWESRDELFEILEAADAAIKAQYWEMTQGMDPEVGAQKAAEKAIASAGKFADEETKKMMAKKAANMYI